MKNMMFAIFAIVLMVGVNAGHYNSHITIKNYEVAATGDE